MQPRELNPSPCNEQRSGIRARLVKLPDRRKRVNPAFLPHIRILKKDIRRTYGEMFVNVVNLHDPALLRKFLHEFCVPLCRFDFIPNIAVGRIRRIGLPEILFAMIQSQIKMPDGVSSLFNVSIHVPLLQPRSKIVGKLSFHGTRLYEIKNHPSWLSNNYESSLENHELMGSSVLRPEPSEPDTNALEFILLDTPLSVTIEGIFTMTVDDAHRIESFELACSCYRETHSHLLDH
jgi:hypothetical protein